MQNGRYFQYSPNFVLLRKFFYYNLSGCVDYRTSVSGLWHDESIYTSFASGFCGSLADASICISFYEFLFCWFGIRRYILGISDTKKAWKILAMLGILMILFYIWRMLRYFPGNPPMSYYYGNVLLNLHHIIKSFLQI